MINFFGTTEAHLNELFTSWGEKPYRVHQVFNWVYNYRVRDFDAMTNLSKALRSKLKETFHFGLPRVVETSPSYDGSVKYLLQLDDGARVEAVWMPAGPRKTLCISTQAGCRMACSFCQTATLGLQRNLSTAEILGQYLAVLDDQEEGITNIVVMGMGEPLDNYGPVVDALRLMVSPQALRLSTRRVTLSTSGLVDKIDRLAGEGLHVNLAISLNATDNTVRDRIMPINRKYPIETLLDSLKNFPLKANRRLTFEYVLLEGINDTDSDALRLARLLRGLACKVNLIPFNAFGTSVYRPPGEDRILAFQNILISRNYSVFIRKNRGSDILGACGQLAAQTTASPLQYFN
ncbi:MAG: 23S rRNA (adenine(2503)-C(2))-methyltransferase RlmN [Nitrospinaceae bacterium]|jgi:23S rRNA (adenine2503-C2)-methyltransferase|nr:MAG: 23S rRNA (adenine(2503)-C(2))-methyltransferase RlmN [Nitrospinaceae bacterium]